PAASARAFTKEITWARTRHSSAATPARWLPESAKAHHATPPSTAPSAKRSQVASNTAPYAVPVPWARAIAPSNRSSMANPHTVNVAHSNIPWPKNTRAHAIAPTVPTRVIPFGVSPARTSALPIGSVTRDTEARARTLSMVEVANGAGCADGRVPVAYRADRSDR